MTDSFCLSYKNTICLKVYLTTKLIQLISNHTVRTTTNTDPQLDTSLDTKKVQKRDSNMTVSKYAEKEPLKWFERRVHIKKPDN